MMDTLKPYPEYKDSGLPWLGCIPQHWEVRRNGRLFMQRNSTGYGHLPILEVSLKTGVRVRNMDSLKRKQVISDRNKYKWAAKGDIAYNMMRMWQGAVGVAPVDGLVSPAYVVVRPRSEVEPRYFSYLFRTDIYKKEVDGFSRGIVKDRNRLYWEDFKRIPSCFPSLAEQKIIADYLDANAVKVRRFIHNRRRMIEVLNEQKQAIINRAVTRGLNPDAPLKPSGIDWLGDIPAHWEIVPLKRICQMKSGEGITSFDIDENGAYPVYGGNGQRGYTKKYTHEGEYVLIGRQGALCGNVHLVSGRFWASEHAVVVSLSSNHCIDWFVALLIGMELNQYSIAAAQPGLSVDRIINLRVPLPSVEEQKEIANFISIETDVIFKAIDRAQREINLIREYRTRLISDVVTGKIDVRHLAPSPGSEDLEEAAEMLEPLEDDIDDVEMDEEEEINESD